MHGLEQKEPLKFVQIVWIPDDVSGNLLREIVSDLICLAEMHKKTQNLHNISNGKLGTITEKVQKNCYSFIIEMNVI